jgi:glycosyltransferase involved in cell wall biosynthesis
MFVSVLINNYNYADYLEDAVASVLRQSHGDFEIILVDDGSTDHSRDL